jgi:hypothetical protein
VLQVAGGIAVVGEQLPVLMAAAPPELELELELDPAPELELLEPFPEVFTPELLLDAFAPDPLPELLPELLLLLFPLPEPLLFPLPEPLLLFPLPEPLLLFPLPELLPLFPFPEPLLLFPLPELLLLFPLPLLPFPEEELSPPELLKPGFDGVLEQAPIAPAPHKKVATRHSGAAERFANIRDSSSSTSMQ